MKTMVVKGAEITMMTEDDQDDQDERELIT